MSTLKIAKCPEPEARRVPPPEHEPDVRIGVIIEEDEKRRVSFACQQPAVLGAADAPKRPLEPGALHTVELQGEECRVTAGGIEIIRSYFPLVVEPLESGRIAPGAGIRVDGITAGRGFHWKKEISETFPGLLEFIPGGGRLVVVNTVGFEFYVTCVAASEMSGTDCPAEFCRAQATAARSWAYAFLSNKYPGRAYALCNDDMSQRYQGTTHLSSFATETVHSCRGDFLVEKNGTVCPAYYSKSCGGRAEDPALIFGSASEGMEAALDAPEGFSAAFDASREEDCRRWLDASYAARQPFFCGPQAVPETQLKRYLGAVDEAGSYFRWQQEVDAAVVLNNLREKFGLRDAAAIVDIRGRERGLSGRYLSLEIEYLTVDGQTEVFLLADQYNIRSCLHESFLYSSAFVYELDRISSGQVRRIRMTGGGWGHGVGLCQIGAVGMALAGYSYIDILRHYYPGAALQKAY